MELAPVNELLSLLSIGLGPASMTHNRGYWSWKHEKNPFGPSWGLVALAEGHPVALRTFLRWRWVVGNTSLQCGRAVDTVTHPSWRRQGLFKRLTLELIERTRGEGLGFVFNTPNRVSRAGYLEMGWENLGRVPLLVRLVRPARVVRAVCSRNRQAEGGAWATERLRSVNELLEQPGLPDLLATTHEEAIRPHTPRTLEYLRWRYVDPPMLRYEATWRLRRNSGAILIARCRFRRGLKEVGIAELLTSDDIFGRTAGLDLLREVASLPEVDHITAVAAPNSQERRLLRESGWIHSWIAPRLIARPLQSSMAAPSGPAAWPLSLGDLELF